MNNQTDVIKYKDMALAPNPHGRGAMPKHEKFSWANANSPGVFMMLAKSDLAIDVRYQRGEVTREKVLEIARNWDWRLFGVLSVIMRKDNSFWIYDGGHRWRASGYRADIKELPCLVFEAHGIDDEAKAFVGTNTIINNVRAYQLFKASILAGEPNSIATNALMKKFGYSACQDGKKPYGISAIATIKRMVEIDTKAAEKVFAAAVSIAVGGEQIPCGTLRALFYLSRNMNEDILSGSYLNRLIATGIPGIEAALRRERAIIGKGGERVEAKAVLDILNKGRRYKLELDTKS